MFDLIGDIHGHAKPLESLLGQLGYTDREGSGIWRHTERKVIFLGDFIDRGPAQLETVQIARAMVENGTALAVMGNHEFNGILWATLAPGGAGHYLREHSETNRNQHAAFLEAVGALEPDSISERQRDIVEWFKTLPIYLDLAGLRVIHACWHRPSLEALAPHLDNRQCVRKDSWPEMAARGSLAYEAAEILLKGLEIELPGDTEFLDKDNNPRRHIRTRWWEATRLTYRDLAIVPADVMERIPHTPIPEDILPGYDGEKPLFVGHYWLDGDPAPLAPHIACLDYSIARQDLSDSRSSGKLCAYRWDGETNLTAGNFVCVPG
jgi:hypothetical protein